MNWGKQMEQWVQLPATEPTEGLYPFPPCVYTFGRVFCEGANPPIEVLPVSDKYRHYIRVRRGDRACVINLIQDNNAIIMALYAFAFQITPTDDGAALPKAA